VGSAANQVPQPDDGGNALFSQEAFSGKAKGSGDLAQKGTDTSLIERFMYPKFGRGQLWEHVADQIREKGGEIHMGWKVVRIHCSEEGGVKRVVSLDAVNCSARCST
jgi:protoporphyrinogen oxidase